MNSSHFVFSFFTHSLFLSLSYSERVHIRLHVCTDSLPRCTVVPDHASMLWEADSKAWSFFLSFHPCDLMESGFEMSLTGTHQPETKLFFIYSLMAFTEKIEYLEDNITSPWKNRRECWKHSSVKKRWQLFPLIQGGFFFSKFPEWHKLPPRLVSQTTTGRWVDGSERWKEKVLFDDCV